MTVHRLLHLGVPQLGVLWSQPASFRRARITVGDSPIYYPEQSDWPKSLWVCRVPDDILKGEEGGVAVRVQYEGQEVWLSVQRGQSAHSAILPQAIN